MDVKIGIIGYGGQGKTLSQTIREATTSRISEKCSKCKDKDDCNEKRMEACLYLIPNTIQSALPNINLNTDIKIGNEYINAEDIQKSIQQQIIGKLGACEKFMR